MFLKNNHNLLSIPILAPNPPASKGFPDNFQQLDTEQFTCPSCGVIAKHNLTLQPPQSTHYASLKCQECDRFIKWVGKPENQKKAQERSRLITAWLSNPQLNINDWERVFLTNISTTQKLSPKQQEHYNKLYSRLGGGVAV